MSVVLQSSGGGSVTLQEPSTASNRTLTLPDATGTVAYLDSSNILQLSGGIAFPATQITSSNVNTLDDYEEGTWTPTARSGAGSITSYTSNGTYTKIGRTVFVTGVVNLTNVGTASGQLTVGALPFTTITSSSRPFVGVVREDTATGVIYASFGFATSTEFLVSTLTNGAIVWTNTYSYTFSLQYQTN